MAITISNLPRLLKYKQEVNPLWADDTGRNSNSGKYSGTFIGYFSQITLTFGKTKQSEMTIIKNALEVPIIEDVTYVDTKTGETKTKDYYGEKISAELTNWNGKYSGFSLKLTAVDKE